MSIFDPFYFLTFLREKPLSSATRLGLIWKSFLQGEGQCEFIATHEDGGATKTFVNKPIILDAKVARTHGVESWRICASFSRAPYIEGGILEESHSPRDRFSSERIREMLDKGIADIAFESENVDELRITGRTVPLYLEHKLDQIGFVKGGFKDSGNESDSQHFQNLLLRLESLADLMDKTVSFRYPSEAGLLSEWLRDCDAFIIARLGSEFAELLRPLGFSVKKWKSLN